MKLLKQLALLTSVSLISVLPTKIARSSNIELTYRASEIQCGRNSNQLNIVIDVYHDDTLLVENLSVGESVLVPDLEGVSMDYEVTNSSCSLSLPTELHLTQDDPLPDLPGAYDQDSIATLLEGLESYEDLYLVELGTTNTSSFAYDLQDVVFVVNNSPESETSTIIDGDINSGTNTNIDVTLYAD